MRSLLALLLLAAAPVAPRSTPIGITRVRLDTQAGPITLALDGRHAPRTVANFLQYVDDGRLDGTTFYRAARAKGRGAGGFIEGGIGSDPRRALPPVPLEPTSRTGLHHGDGAVSMARFTPDSATANFSILAGASPSMDAHGRDPGFAVFGRVVDGMAVVKRILAQPAAGGVGVMKGQMLTRPVTIVHAARLDGSARPTGLPKPWTIGLR
ncbi:peptidylprolyl isomerase [Sphingomonas bacterium]|uniref:peptidylprolyl isomerase n=1 Tax=Sphingomonas bacterium TaxID=1895847 RepID=UPI001576F3CD|nr:peptidylprolyl isomerase [Sphingomonas bacterium]